MIQKTVKDLPKGVTNNIREVFGYLQRFKNRVFVLKIDDDLLDAPLLSLLVKDIVHIKNMGIRVVMVAGARNSIDKVLEKYNVHTQTHEGIRLTTEAAMPLVKLGSSNVTNSLLTLLSENGVNGVLGNWVRAREIGVINGIDFEYTGKVDSIKLPVVNTLLEEGLVPIFSNIGWGLTGKPYNISSNEVAMTLAKSIHAAKLFFVGRKSGVPALENGQVTGLEIRESGVYSSIELEKARELLELHQKDFDKDSLELIQMALNACSAGVNRVHIIDGSKDGILLQEIFSTKGQGTMFHANLHANIRNARVEDIPEMLHIMQPYVEQGVLVQRSVESIGKKIDSYYVYSVDDALHGCCALTRYSRTVAEIEAVIVDTLHRGKGTGQKMISYLTKIAAEEGIKRVFVLTTQSKDYFLQLGFKEASLDILPKERQKQYSTDRNSKVLVMEVKPPPL